MIERKFREGYAEHTGTHPARACTAAVPPRGRGVGILLGGNKMKKVLCTVLALAMALTLLAGCGGAPVSSGSTAASGSAGGAEDTTIKVAALVSGYENTYPGMWQEVCDAFTAQTGIKVELTLEQNLEDVLNASMQGGDYPDVIHLATGRPAGLTEQFINGKMIADITDVLDMTVPGEDVKVGDKIIEGFTETSATNPYGDGKTYLAPMFYSPCGLFYNAGLFEEKGWEVPATWDEMWELGDKAKAEGIYLFTYPTAGYFDAFLYALMNVVGGPEFFNAATNYEEGIWETPEADKLFEILDKLADYTHPSTPAQANNQDFTRNQLMVMTDEALFMPNGTWIIGEMAEAEIAKDVAEGFKWGMTALPPWTRTASATATLSWSRPGFLPVPSISMRARRSCPICTAMRLLQFLPRRCCAAYPRHDR